VKGQEEAQYHTVVCWDKLAELTVQYVKKGRLILVDGRLQYRTFTDSEGKERGSVEIVASDVQFLDKHAGNGYEVNLDEVPG
jgi:single-strand DNA-binding protein